MANLGVFQGFQLKLHLKKPYSSFPVSLNTSTMYKGRSHLASSPGPFTRVLRADLDMRLRSRYGLQAPSLDTADSANVKQLGPDCACAVNIAAADRGTYLEKAVFGIIAFV